MSRKIRLFSVWFLLMALALPLGTGSSLARESWFVALDRQIVPPTPRSAGTQLFDAGAIDTDGFRDMVISFGGEFQEGLPSSGRVGAILIPDHAITEKLLRTEGVFVFPTEIEYRMDDTIQGQIFMSKSVQTKIAFPRYRVYLYNETTSGASMSVFVYRSR